MNSYKAVAVKKSLEGDDTSRSAKFFLSTSDAYEYVLAREAKDGSEWLVADIVVPWADRFLRWLATKFNG